MRIYLCVTDSQDFAYLDPDLKHTGTEKLAKYISMFSLKLKFKQKYKVIYKKKIPGFIFAMFIHYLFV